MIYSRLKSFACAAFFGVLLSAIQDSAASAKQLQKSTAIGVASQSYAYQCGGYRMVFEVSQSPNSLQAIPHISGTNPAGQAMILDTDLTDVKAFLMKTPEKTFQSGEAFVTKPKIRNPI